MLKFKPLRPEVVTVIASAFFLACLNQPLWAHLSKITESSTNAPLIQAVFGLLLLCVFNLFLTLFAFRWVLKPLLISLLLSAAIAVIYMQTHDAMITREVFSRLFSSNTSELYAQLNSNWVISVLVLGVLPALVVWRMPIDYRIWHQELFWKTAVIVASCALLVTLAMSNYQSMASLFRNHKELRLLATPSNLIRAGSSYLTAHISSARKPFKHIAMDAVKSPAWAVHSRKSLTVLVIGESARAENFSVLGYGRQTNPRLSQVKGLLAYSNMYSCGTETSVSVPCMFSSQGRRGFEPTIARTQEGLLDVVTRAGFRAIWRDNQSGCKDTCTRVTYENVSNSSDPQLCANGECADQILLKNLQQTIDNLSQDTVLVLHQMGSHGPAYYRRYPKAFERFTPTCTTGTLDECSVEQIVNSYDNSIVYTDTVLADLIEILQRNDDKIASSMIYLSDHGESLGEYNLFLHGTPFVLAPEQQKHIPLLMWFSDSYTQNFALNRDCLAGERSAPLSQDNLYHSMIDLLQIQTSDYSSADDMFAACRQTPVQIATKIAVGAN